jgi:glucose/arabinose dehydrogenase
MNTRSLLTPLTALACGVLTVACGDDGTTDVSVDWTYDASVDAGVDASLDTNVVVTEVDTDVDTTGLIGIGSTSGANADTAPSTEASSADAGASVDVTDGSAPADSTAAEASSTSAALTETGVLEVDAATTDTTIDGGTSSEIDTPDGGDASSSAATDAGASDTTLPDAEVFVPDGGAVLRPAELEFDEDYLEQLALPEGFDVEVFAIPGGKARMLAARGNSIYVTRPVEGDVLRLEDTNADGVADVTATAVSGYPSVHGIAFNDDTVYLATTTTLLRGTVNQDGTFGTFETLFDDLPDGGQHALRTLGVGPDNQLYLSIGSSCDACAESNPEHATLLQIALDGSSRTVFASGLRNTIGFDWDPGTSQLWGVDNGSDWRGDDLPPEELNLIEQGNDYGWPYCYGQQNIDPIIPNPPNATKAEYCAATTPAVLENQAHEAPIGLVFYDGLAFPEEYRGNAFVAMHGSWNRIPATGYKIVRVVFEAGQPIEIEDFVSGFLNAQGLATFGRPAGITVDAQGALLFSDDSNGVVYRVTADQ